MSFIKLPQEAFDIFTVIARPEREFHSSSVAGINGELSVFKRISSSGKDSSVFNDSSFSEESPESFLVAAQISVSESSNIKNEIERYVQSVNESPFDPRSSKKVEVIRFEPSFRLTSDTMRKNVIRTVLFPHYRIAHQGIGWGFTNYLSLHFPDNIGPTSSSIIYPNPVEDGRPIYSPEIDFTVELYAKPSYSSKEYRAGTLFHVPSCISISMISGSKKDKDGKVDSFRLLLQLSHSAETPPSNVDFSTIGTYPNDLTFVSDDLFINKNHWHHIAVCWSPNYNDSTGSIYIDAKEAMRFHCTESMVPFSASLNDRSAIFIGNYYNGQDNEVDGPHGFFCSGAIANEGVTDAFNLLFDSISEPSSYSLENPFRGEIHEIKVWNSRRDHESILTSSMIGSTREEELLFYVPPMFRKETTNRKVLQTPFQSFDSSTDDPFNVALSFGVGGHEINVENHTREFIKGIFPRLLHLTASEIQTQQQEFKEANYYIYSTGSNVRRNLTILPCDNGKFMPNFDLLFSGSSSEFSKNGVMEKFNTDNMSPDLSFVNLSDLVPSSSLFPGLVQDSSILDDIMGSSPENPGVAPGAVLTIYQRTRDNSSNAVSFYDASNIFYGSRIEPKTYELIDNSFTGSNGTLPIRLLDNGRGGLYRADCSSPHAEWSNTGFIMYSEGISVITSPYLGEMFGKDDFTVRFRGNQPVHVLETQAISPAWMINSSSNPDWKNLYLTDYENDTQPGFVRITRVNFHDENLNIVARTDLSQPINKRSSDRIMFRTKFDF